MIRAAFRMLARRRSRSSPTPRVRSPAASVTGRCRGPGAARTEERREDTATGSLPHELDTFESHPRGDLVSPSASRSAMWAREESRPCTRAPGETFSRTAAAWWWSCDERGRRTRSDRCATRGRKLAAARGAIGRDSLTFALLRSRTEAVWAGPSSPAAVVLSCREVSTVVATVAARAASGTASSGPLAEAGASAVRSSGAGGGVATRAGRRVSGST